MNRIARCSIVTLALAGASQLALAADPLEFHGYMRAGMGVSGEGGKGACYGIGTVNPFRLGNECDTVVEPTFTGRITAPGDKSSWGIVVMPKVYQRWGEINRGDSLPTEFGQIYLFGENVPQLANGRVWAGKRYYQRVQTGINDEFLESLDGNGAGVEDMELGFGRLSVAWNGNIYANGTDKYNTLTGDAAIDGMYVGQGNKISMRLTNIQTVPDGALAIYAHYAKDLTRDDKSTTPATSAPTAHGTYHIAAYHTLNGVLNGSNFLGLGYTSTEDGVNIFDLTAQQSGMFSAIGWDAVARYRKISNNPTASQYGTNGSEFAIGGRLDGRIANGPFRWLFEAGFNQVKPDHGESQQMYKLTPAIALNAGNDPWSRPTVRVYYNYVKWNDAVNKGDALGGFRWTSEAQAQGVDPNATKGSTLGVQMEAWW